MVSLIDFDIICTGLVSYKWVTSKCLDSYLLVRAPHIIQLGGTGVVNDINIFLQTFPRRLKQNKQNGWSRTWLLGPVTNRGCVYRYCIGQRTLRETLWSQQSSHSRPTGGSFATGSS
jgi:hypothetical protein